MYEQHEAWLQTIFSEQKWICLTADIWSSKNRSFLGVSGHFMDENLDRQSYVLSCKYFPAPHNYQTISEFFQLVYSRFGINSRSIVATVTDNGRNFVKAFQTFGRNDEEFKKFLLGEDDENQIQPLDELDCHEIFSVLNSLYEGPVFDDVDVDYEYDTLCSLLHSPIEENIQNDATKSEHDEFIRSRISNIAFDDQAAFALSNRLSCNAHNLNLVGSTDGLRAHRNKQYSKKYSAVFEKLNMLWHYSGLQASSEIIIAHLGTNLNKPSKTRWNDIYQKVIFSVHLQKMYCE